MRALLESYLPNYTFLRPSSGGSVPSSLFKQHSFPDTIPLPEEFKTEFERVSVDPIRILGESEGSKQGFLLY